MPRGALVISATPAQAAISPRLSRRELVAELRRAAVEVGDGIALRPVSANAMGSVAEELESRQLVIRPTPTEAVTCDGCLEGII